MTLANYISDLLYRHDCVIVPNFGGFVTNTIGAKVNHFTHTFYPPTKQITFNGHLTNNDGLLANYIASAENISFEGASQKIEAEISKWKSHLKNESLSIKKVGTISLNKESQFVFEPDTTTNFLVSSFGLASYNSPAVKRLDTAKNVPVTTQNSGRLSSLVKYAATAAIVLSLGAIGWNGYTSQQQKEILAKEQQLEQKIQSATFVIDNPLPTINLTVTKEAAKPFHIIAGAFQFPENAAKKVEQLKKKGFNATILGKNKWGLTQVAFNSYANRTDAFTDLNKIRLSESKDAWILIKKFQ